jgi:hypothetical protein
MTKPSVAASCGACSRRAAAGPDALLPRPKTVTPGSPRRVHAMPGATPEALRGDPRLIRHWGELGAVRDR